MLFGYELKKVWQRVSPLLMSICLVGIAVITMLISLIAFNHIPESAVDRSQDYAALSDIITNWDTERRVEIKAAFTDFYSAYKKLNTATVTESDTVVVSNYQIARTAFEHFYSDYYNQFIYPENNEKVLTNYLLVKGDEINQLNEVLQLLDGFFIPELTTAQAIRKGLDINANWNGTAFETVLDNLQVLIIPETDLIVLQDFFTAHPANIAEHDYSDEYCYAINQYWLSIDRNTPHSDALNQYSGFTEYANQTTSSQAVTTAEYRLNHPNEDFAQPFTFGKIYNQTKQVSLFDFVFTNLEMAAIPLLLLVAILATATFFTDTYQSTIITSVVATKNRTLVIVTKTAVVLTLAVCSLLACALIYLIGGWLFFQATPSSDILFLFNGTTPMTMSAVNYFVLYLLGWLFKFLPLIALAGIFSFLKTKPWVIVGSTFAIVLSVVLSDALLGNFSFYRFMPWQALNIMRYFGATLFIAPTPAGSNLWYTLPVMTLFTGYLYWQLVHNFRHRDF